MTDFFNRFGGNAIKPAQPQFLALDLTTDQTLVWPLESTTGSPYVAAQIDADPTTTGRSVTMPPANQGSTGVATIMTNVGANSFTLRDSAGAQIAVLASTQTWMISLIDNSTEAGVWRAYQMASTSSNAVASALAGAGLEADGAQLRISLPTVHYVSSQAIGAAQRANVVVYSGSGAATFQFGDAAVLGAGWDAMIINEGDGALSLTTTGSDTINGGAGIVLEPGNSCVIIAEAGGFNTVGNVASPLGVINGGTGATNGTGALVNFGGSSTGIAMFTAPSVAAVLALLGVTSSIPLTESTITTNQALSAGSTQTAFVATNLLTMTLPLTSGLTTAFIFAVYAQGGDVTLTPNVADSINGGTAGASLVLTTGQSALFTTDANGHWWPFFLASGGGGGGGSGTVTSVGLSAPATFVVTGSPVTVAGALALTWATQSPNLVFAGPTSGAAAMPTFRALVAADIPAAVFTVPTGTIVDFAGTAAPSGYVPCDGSAISRTTYAALFAVIGSTWGDGDGSTTFNLPSLARRTAVGSGGVATGTLGNTVGSLGGEENHTLTVAQLAVHAHTISALGTFATGDVEDGTMLYNGGISGGNRDLTTAAISGTVQNTGSGNPHNNMQPSAVVLKIIKT